MGVQAAGAVCVRLRPAVLALLVAAGSATAACNSVPKSTGTGTGGHETATSTTLPPLPPIDQAYVALIGTGSALGTGTQVVPVDVSAPGGRVRKAISVGTFPDAIAVAPNGKTIYVANFGSNTITPIDVADGRAGKAIPAGRGPAGIAITPDGKRAYVSDDGGLGQVGDTVTPIDLATDRPLAAIRVGLGPQGISISPDGTTAYVTDAGAIPALSQQGPPVKTVTPINIATDTAGRPITVGNGPEAIAISPSGTAFVANTDSDSITPIDLTNDTPLAPVALNGAPVALVATSQDVYVVTIPSSSGGAYSVTPISIATDTVGAPIAVPKGAQAITLAPGGATAWVTSILPGELTPIHLATRRAGSSIAIAGGPYSLVVVSVHQTRGAPSTTKPKAKPKAKAKPKKS
jgi:YVTN family beta-propeller protein